MKFNASSVKDNLLHEIHSLVHFKTPIVVYKRSHINVFVTKVQWAARHATLRGSAIDWRLKLLDVQEPEPGYQLRKCGIREYKISNF
jgi:hypothetical protein